MLDNEDLKWIATTSTELNSMLQQIARSADLAKRHHGEHNHIDLLGERVEVAAKTAQSLFDRVTSKILSRTIAKTGPPTFTVVSGTAEAPVPPNPPASAIKATEQKRIVPAPKRVFVPRSSKPKTNGKQPSAALMEIPAGVKVKNAKGPRDYLLFIEDEVEVADIASDMLADEGYKVILAQDGFEALKIYQQVGKQIGLVILDFFLPVMDGDAVFDELRELNPNVNVVLSSGFAEQSKISMMLGKGLRGFIPKPYTREKLLDQVRSALEATRPVPA